jgi:membrane protein implicated in regulation of membrane protease activity
MEGLSASAVVIAILLGILLLVVFDAFCLVRLGTADTAHVVPRFAWAVLIVCCSPLGGLAYLLVQRLRRRSPEPLTMRPRPLRSGYAWHGPWLAEYKHAPASPAGHAVTVVAIAGAVLLAEAGELLVAVGILVCLVIIAFLRNTPPG